MPQAFTSQDVEDAALGRLVRRMYLGKLSKDGARWRVERPDGVNEGIDVYYGDTPEEVLRKAQVCK